MTHRIHGAAIDGVPWIPSIYPIHVSINIPAPWIRHGLLNKSMDWFVGENLQENPMIFMVKTCKNL